MIDVRARSETSFGEVIEIVCARRGRQAWRSSWCAAGRAWKQAPRPTALLGQASARLGREIVGVARGGASDASHFAGSIPLTVDGLGPRGGHAHSPEEYVLGPSLRERAEVAMVLAAALLEARTGGSSQDRGSAEYVLDDDSALLDAQRQ